MDLGLIQGMSEELLATIERVKGIDTKEPHYNSSDGRSLEVQKK